MYESYKIICTTPAGRRRYMKILAPYILKGIKSGTIDEWHIWVNTKNVDDIFFLERLHQEFDRIKLVPQPKKNINGNLSINDFFEYCIANDTIYIRFDDDIVWIENDFFEKFLDFRIKHKEYFLVFPLIINNAICTHILQQNGLLILNCYIKALASDDIGWKNPKFAKKLHGWFIELVKKKEVEKLHFGYVPISLNRFSINCMAWFGKDFKIFNGIITGDDEENLTVHKTRELKRCNCIYGETIVSHFAFFTQRKYLDSSGLLNEYENLILNHSDSYIRECYKIIREIVNAIEKKEKSLIDISNYYEKGHFENLHKLRQKIGRLKIPWLCLITLGELKNLFKKTYLK